MRKFMQFFVPFSVTGFCGLLGYLWWVNQAHVPRGEPVAMAVQEVDGSTPFVRVEGMAHYPIKIRQTVPASLFSEERVYYLFPMFPPDDTSSRQVSLLLRTQRKPDDLVSYESIVVEGHVTRPTPEKVPFSAEMEFGKHSDYFFTDDLWVLEPWRVDNGEEVWELEP